MKIGFKQNEYNTALRNYEHFNVAKDTLVELLNELNVNTREQLNDVLNGDYMKLYEVVYDANYTQQNVNKVKFMTEMSTLNITSLKIAFEQFNTYRMYSQKVNESDYDVVLTDETQIEQYTQLQELCDMLNKMDVQIPINIQRGLGNKITATYDTNERFKVNIKLFNYV